LGAERQHQSLRLKMGIHEGSCLAVTLNAQQDYFGQTVNIASRVQACGLTLDRGDGTGGGERARRACSRPPAEATLRPVALTGIAARCHLRDILSTAAARRAD